MEKKYTKQESFIKAQKKVKNIIGFYTHIAASLFIIPFIVLINFKFVPEEFHWYWIFIGAWFVGLFIHWAVIFKLSKLNIKEDWKEKKIKEIMNEDDASIESDHTQELFYIDAKKRVKEVKGFYAFLIVNMISIPLIIYVNLEFVPGFHFFWFAVIGMLFPLFMMWLGIFGFQQFGLGKNWQKKKLEEIMKEDYGHKI